MNTKSVQLTEDEVIALIHYNSSRFYDKGINFTDTIDRMKYLDKRLKDFKEPEVKEENPTKKEPMSSW